MLNSPLLRILFREASSSSRNLRMTSVLSSSTSYSYSCSSSSDVLSDNSKETLTSPTFQEQKPTLPSKYVGKIVSKLWNLPKFVLKHEILNLFPGCNITESDVSIVFDEKVRIKHWRVCFNSSEDYQKAAGMVMQKRRLGPRMLKFEPENIVELLAEGDPNHPNRLIDYFRGDSLLMLNCPEEVITETIENFFHDYHLGPQPFHHIRFVHQNVRTPLKRRIAGEMRPTCDVVERRVIVKFASPMEAFRAFREKNREFLESNTIDLRLIQ